QGLVIHKPLPPAATLVARTRVTEILDKGADKGALIYTERQLKNKATGEVHATLTSTSFARGNGGFGGKPGPQPEPHPIPERAPDAVCDLPTLPQAALIYRLSGDPNPLHADPKVATMAGFKAPILHGLCSLGVAGHAILKTYCDYDATRFKSLKLRFASPVYPGETIRTEMWKDGNVISFRARVIERDAVVLNNGRTEVAG
ncbi:MAG: MaoC family dehydratase, partial [Hyphomicrobiaceae bacterium]|nr:MaoC family dehydratase [Hyphomicrobiaceae bacterium]